MVELKPGGPDSDVNVIAPQVRIPLEDLEVLWGDSSLVKFFAGMKYVLELRDAMAAIRDAAIRGTDGMDDDIVKARVQLMSVSLEVLLKRLEYELDNALANLEHFFEKL